MYSSSTQIRVRYAETDQMGYVYYGHYAQYYEVGRAELLRQLGLTYRHLEENGIIMPVAQLNVKYFRPATYDDLLTIKTSINEVPASKVTFRTTIMNDNGELLNVGDTTLVFLDKETFKKVEPPSYLVEKFLPFFQPDRNA